MITAHNLSSDQVLSFDDHTTPEYAVAYAWHADMGMLSLFFSMNQNNNLSWKANVIHGAKTVSMGDWCALKQ